MHSIPELSVFPALGATNEQLTLDRRGCGAYIRSVAARRRGIILCRGVHFLGVAIPKNFKVIQSNGTMRYDTRDVAKALVAQGDAVWTGGKEVTLRPDVSKRGIWEPRKSGIAGPSVMQLT